MKILLVCVKGFHDEKKHRHHRRGRRNECQEALGDTWENEYEGYLTSRTYKKKTPPTREFSPEITLSHPERKGSLIFRLRTPHCARCLRPRGGARHQGGARRQGWHTRGRAAVDGLGTADRGAHP